MVLTPAIVFKQMGKNAPSRITATRDHMPMPSHSTRTGRSATRGVAYMAARNGFIRNPRRGYQPSNRPSGTAVTTAVR